MPKWTKPSEGLPECECGDRVVVILREREHARAPLKPRLIILEATEHGWNSPDELYVGYSPEDGELWSMESDVCQIANVH